MIRTMVQITEEQQEQLRRLSAATGRSMADLVREGIEGVLARRPGDGGGDRIARARAVMGKFASGRTDVSAKHDRHLAEVFR